MHLLYLTAESIPTFRSDVAVLFGRYLPAQGVTCDVVAPLAPGATESPEWLGGRAIGRRIDGGAMRFRIMSVWHGWVTALRADARIYHALQVRDMPVLAALALAIARFKRLPFYYWMSYPIPEGQIALARDRGLRAGWMKFLYPWVSGRAGRFLLKHWVLPRADHVFVQSPRMKEELSGAGVPPDRMTPVLMGVDMRALHEAGLQPTRDGRLAGRRVIGYLGTVDRPRQIERLFAMLVLVQRVLPDAVLLVVGDTDDGVHRHWLHEQARLAGVSDAIVWAGWLPTQDAWRLILNAEVAVSPFPRGELLDSASPTKVPEYLALGVPVVCNDNPDQAATIRDSGAGLCVPYTAEDFAAAVLKLMGMDASARAAMVAAGQRYVAANRDYRHIASEVAAVYRRLLH